MENAPLVGSSASASLLLGRKLDSIPFSIYHVQIILVLGVVGFVEGYDLALGGSLLVLAKEPLHLTPEQVRWLAVGPILFLVVGAFTAASISDRLSRKSVMQIGVISSTFFTLLIPLTQTGTQLLVIRLLTGLRCSFRRTCRAFRATVSTATASAPSAAAQSSSRMCAYPSRIASVTRTKALCR